MNLHTDRLNVKCEEETPELGLISYADLEKIPRQIETKYEDLGRTFDQMPTNTFSDLATSKTFDNIPSDVFDQIPRAVTAREERRLIKLQEKLLQQRTSLDEDSFNKPAAKV